MRTTTLTAMAMMSTALTGCFGVGDGDAVARRVADRFVEQVNANTCDEASGFDIDDTTWTDACQATVANLADGSTMPTAEMHAADSGEVQRNYIMLSSYRDINDVAATLHIELDGNGILTTDATLTRISSDSAAAFGDTDVIEYSTFADAPVEPEGQALIEAVQSQLSSGSCGEIVSMLAPQSEFLTADTTECESVAKLYAANPPTAGGSWRSAVYSVVDVMRADEAYGITRTDGESNFDFFDRVLEVITPTNRKVKFVAQNPDVTIEAVLYEGQWYLLNVEIEVDTFAYTF